MKTFLTKYASWVQFSLTILAIAANGWLTKNYVPREEYTKDQKAATDDRVAWRQQAAQTLTNLSTIVAEIPTFRQSDLRQEETLRDHETRIRAVERGN